MMFYKVVRKINGSFFSMCQRNYRVEYTVNEWVKPTLRNSKLFVFSDLESASFFTRTLEMSYDIVCMFTCVVDNPVKANVIPMMVGDIREFWGDSRCSVRDLDRAPHGTYFADRVKLLEEVTCDR